MPAHDETTTVQAAIAGDPEAFAELFDTTLRTPSADAPRLTDDPSGPAVMRSSVHFARQDLQTILRELQAGGPLP